MKIQVQNIFKKRVDSYLKNDCKIKFNHVHRLLRLKKVKINDLIVKNPKTFIQENDVIQLLETEYNNKKIVDQGLKTEKVTPHNNFEVLFENEHLHCINKPPNMAMHEGTDSKDNLNTYFPNYRIVHRLDKKTTGVLIYAKTHFAAIHLNDMFKHKQLQKTYIGIVHGVPEDTVGLIDKAIKTEDGKEKEAQTKYKVLWSNGVYSVLKIQPLTGRKRQIRIHLAEHLKTPLIGDYRHSKIKDKFEMHLHCYMLEMDKAANKEIEKITGGTPKLVARIPSYFELFIEEHFEIDRADIEKSITMS